MEDVMFGWIWMEALFVCGSFALGTIGLGARAALDYKNLGLIQKAFFWIGIPLSILAAGWVVAFFAVGPGPKDVSGLPMVGQIFLVLGAPGTLLALIIMLGVNGMIK